MVQGLFSVDRTQKYNQEKVSVQITVLRPASRMQVHVRFASQEAFKMFSLCEHSICV